jgi:hypothetical protein
MRNRPTAAHALGELDSIARGQHPRQKTILEEYRQCPDWQLAARLIVQAIQDVRHSGERSGVLEMPPGWLPPLL